MSADALRLIVQEAMHKSIRYPGATKFGHEDLQRVADAVAVAVLEEVKARFDNFGLAPNLPSQRIVNGCLAEFAPPAAEVNPHE